MVNFDYILLFCFLIVFAVMWFFIYIERDLNKKYLKAIEELDKCYYSMAQTNGGEHVDFSKDANL